MKISVQELLIVLAIVLIIFGPTQIPKLVRRVKKSAREDAPEDGLMEDEEDIPAPQKKKKKDKRSAKQKRFSRQDEDCSHDGE